jgi:hypothetical protein
VSSMLYIKNRGCSFYPQLRGNNPEGISSAEPECTLDTYEKRSREHKFCQASVHGGVHFYWNST